MIPEGREDFRSQKASAVHAMVNFFATFRFGGCFCDHTAVGNVIGAMGFIADVAVTAGAGENGVAGLAVGGGNDRFCEIVPRGRQDFLVTVVTVGAGDLVDAVFRTGGRDEPVGQAVARGRQDFVVAVVAVGAGDLAHTVFRAGGGSDPV